MSHHRSHLTALLRLASVLLSAIVMVMASGAAQAATVSPGGGDDGVVLTPLSPATVSSDMSAEAACPSCTCVLQVNQPHNSGHVPGNINVTASVTCTSAQPRVRVTVDLLKDDF